MEIKINGESFNKEVLLAKGFVLVDFWAPWCEPCVSMLPIVSDLVEKYHNVLKVCTFDVDKNKSDILDFYGVYCVPIFLLFKDGKVVERFVGKLSKDEFINKINCCIYDK